MVGRKTIFIKVFIYIFLVFFLIMMAFGIFMYQSTSATMKSQIGNKCLGIASTVAVLIEQDTDSYKDFIQTLDTSSPYYLRMKENMERIRYVNDNNIRFIYTETRVSDDEMMYVLDGEKVDAELYSPPGSTDALTPTRRTAYTTGEAYVGDFTNNKFGTLLSAYAPIHDATGEVLGLVGVDISMDQYNAVMYNQMAIIVGCIIILTVMVAIMLFLSSGRVEKLVVMDNLTGAYNRPYFMRSLKAQIKYAKKRDIPITVLMADLDHFKQVNDTYGHPFGDVVLETIAHTISSALRKTDCFARYGGEEFTASLPGLTAQAADKVINRIRETVSKTPIHNEETGTDIFVTVSFGVTQLQPGQSATDVIDKADKALYHAKRTRNTVSIYSASMTENTPAGKAAPAVKTPEALT